jgi:16S rRNA A1518/A1519 N6-dimethyltransferase RsmA/KsgA/DIM1 with predicted DNA glycosylase/AP lyase activity
MTGPANGGWRFEVGPGYGTTTDVLGERLPSLTAVEIDEELAVMLKEGSLAMLP